MIEAPFMRPALLARILSPPSVVLGSVDRVTSSRYVRHAQIVCRMASQPPAEAAAPAAAQSAPQKVKKPAVPKEAFFAYSGPPPVRACVTRHDN